FRCGCGWSRDCNEPRLDVANESAGRHELAIPVCLRLAARSLNELVGGRVPSDRVEVARDAARRGEVDRRCVLEVVSRVRDARQVARWLEPGSPAVNHVVVDSEVVNANSNL